MEVASSIAGLATLAGVLYGKIYGYVRAVKGAEKDVISLSTEVRDLSGVLHTLHLMACQLEGDDFDQALRVHHIHYCYQTLEKIRGKLDKAFPDSQKNSSTKSFINKLKWPFSSSETKDLIVELQRHKSTINVALSVDSLSALLKALSRQNDMIEDVKEVKIELKKRRELETRIELSKTRSDVLLYFAKVDTQSSYEMSSKLRHPGTGLWLTESIEFTHWLNTDRSLLWLLGIPGAGKTVLASAVIQGALNRCDEKNAVSYFFCDDKNVASQNPENILGGLCAQLARQHERCFKKLAEYYHICHPDGTQPRRPDPDILSNYLCDMASTFDTVSILVDGLDECGGSTVRVVKLLAALHSSSGNIKLLFLSRAEQHIRDILDDYPQIPIAARSSDLRLYVAAELRARHEDKSLRIKNEELKGHIIDRLVDGADGMFRWVACQIDYLCELPNDRARREALDSLPPDLNSTYVRILHRINASNKHVQKVVQRTLRWLILSRGPLISSRMICEAISVELGDSDIDMDSIPSEDEVLRCCSSLIRQGKHGFEIAHFTVKEFLLEVDIVAFPELIPFRIDPQRHRNELLTTCLTYLSFSTFATGLSPTLESLQEQHQFLEFRRYAVFCWTFYLGDSMSAIVNDLLHKTFSVDARDAFLSTLQFWVFSNYDSPGIPDCKQTVFTRISSGLASITPIHYASMYQHRGFCSWAIENGYNANQLSDYGYPLHFCIHGPAAILSRLRAGDLSGVTFRPPPPPPPTLVMTQSCGPVIDLLIASGADVKDSINFPSLSFLQMAWIYAPNYLGVLVEAGALVSRDLANKFISGSKNRNPWVNQCLPKLRSENFSLADQDLLLQLKLMGNTEDQKYESQLVSSKPKSISIGASLVPPKPKKFLCDVDIVVALQLAVEMDRPQAIVHLVNTHNIDLRYMFTDQRYDLGMMTFLHLSVACGSVQAFSVLLDLGADIHQLSGRRCHILHFCAFDSEIRLFEKILQLNPNVRSVNDRGWTIWHYAAASYNQALLKALQEADANESCEPGILIKALDGSTTLDVFGSSETTGPRNIDRPFPIKEIENDECTIKAARLRCFSFLIGFYRGAVMVKVDGSTALHEWMSGPFQDPEITEDLIKAGIDPQASRNDGKTPLHILFANQHRVSTQNLEMNIALLAASFQTKDDYGSTPLHDLCGSWSNNSLALLWKPVALQILLNLGADIMAKNNKGKSCSYRIGYLFP